MAGDWIKMRGALVDHQKVIAISRALQKSKAFREWLTPGGSGPMNGQIVSDVALRCVTTALLMRGWSAAREQGRFVGDDLFLEFLTIDDLDQMAGAPGIGKALQSVRWAIESEGGIGVTLPNFKEFNVPMTPAEKQAGYRDRKLSTLREVSEPLPSEGNKSGDSVTPREEKRESKSKSLPQQSLREPDREPAERTRKPKAEPSEIDAAFDRLWASYPRKLGKDAARRHFGAQVKPGEMPLIESAIRNYARHCSILATEDQYILHGSTFFNHRWREYADGTWEPPKASLPMGRKIVNEGPPEAPHHPRFVS